MTAYAFRWEYDCGGLPRAPAYRKGTLPRGRGPKRRLPSVQVGPHESGALHYQRGRPQGEKRSRSALSETATLRSQ